MKTKGVHYVEAFLLILSPFVMHQSTDALFSITFTPKTSTGSAAESKADKEKTVWMSCG